MQLSIKYRLVFRYSAHIVFWLFAWLFFVFYYKRYGEINSYTLIASILNLVISAATVYTYNYFIIPKYLLTNKVLKFVMVSLISIILFVYLQLLLTISVLIKLLYTEQNLFPALIDVLMLFLNIIFIVLLAISIKFYKRWTEKEHKTQIIQREKVEAELQMLKTQINPHFLFNTLNSIYVLALRNDNKTADTVLQLSDILDYILYKINEPKVVYTDELHIVENYINLEKIRFGNRVEVELNSQVNDKDLKIAPMLIIPFVENAFKHGVGKSMEKSWIKIHISDDSQYLKIEVMNSKKPDAVKAKSSGIGIKNTTKRLNLLFSESYTLEKIDSQYNYQIKLIIPKL